jgi:hypothetical protein
MRQPVAISLAALLMLVASGAATMAPAEPVTATLSATYSVRWTGIEVGRFDTELQRTGTDYRLTYHARTSGPLEWVARFSSTGWAMGRLDGRTVAPSHFQGASRWRDGEGFWRVSFGADGAVTALELDEWTRSDREPVPAALQRGPDPLSLMPQAMLEAGAGRTVEGRSFDGRRAMRYDLACAAEPSPIAPAALGAATREALVCEVEGALQAGRSKRWSERAEDRSSSRPPVRIWLVPEVGGLAYWPVRIEAESRFGQVTVELDTFSDPRT